MKTHKLLRENPISTLVEHLLHSKSTHHLHITFHVNIIIPHKFVYHGLFQIISMETEDQWISKGK